MSAETSDQLLRVMTLNAAHSRGTSFHQTLLARRTLEANVRAIAQLIHRESPDLVGLQEIDGPSLWSGGFDHLGLLARSAQYPHFIRGSHVRTLGMDYGTALLSRLPLLNAFYESFAPSPPSFTKGFVVANVAWPEGADATLRVVSLHLDFLRKKIRGRQVHQLIDILKGEKSPLVILGDFNCQWMDRDEALWLLSDRLSLKAFEPLRTDFHTFPALRRRLDWILISRELDFVASNVLQDVVSDHFAVTATVRMIG